MASGDECPILNIDVDGAVLPQEPPEEVADQEKEKEMEPVKEKEKEKRRRASGKQPPEGKRPRGKSISKSCVDDDDEEGGEDLSQGKEEDNDENEKRKKSKAGRGSAKAKAKSKSKAKEKNEKKIEPLRDQSKAKKLSEIFNDLPSRLQAHINQLNRDDKTEFINSTILREKGRLKPNTELMYKLLTSKEEAQRSKELMTGYCLEDLSNYPGLNFRNVKCQKNALVRSI